MSNESCHRGAGDFRNFAFAAVFLCYLACFFTPVHAAEYKDDMNSIKSDNNIIYENLTVRTFRGSAYDLPDPTALTISNISGLVAHVTYRLHGATEVTASIYSQAGTFVVQNPINPSEFMMGIFQDNMGFMSGKRPLQASFSRDTGNVYTYLGGLMQMYRNETAYIFGQVRDQPNEANLIGYGINFYYSLDGNKYTRISDAYQLNMSFSPGVYCYETYAAPVPAGAAYLRVEINDISVAYLTNGQSISKNSSAITALASVAISGDSLALGVPEQPVSAPPNELAPSSETPAPASSVAAKAERVSSASVSKSSSSSASSEASEIEYAAISKIEISSTSSASSKFEGTITKSSKSEKSKASSKPKEKSETSHTDGETEAESLPPDEPSREEIMVYEFPSRDAGNDMPNKILNGAIISASGGIVLYILMHAKPR